MLGFSKASCRHCVPPLFLFCHCAGSLYVYFPPSVAKHWARASHGSHSIPPQRSLAVGLFMSNVFMISGSVSVQFWFFFFWQTLHIKSALYKRALSHKPWDCRLSATITVTGQMDSSLGWNLWGFQAAVQTLPFPGADLGALVWLWLEVWGEQEGSRIH